MADILIVDDETGPLNSINRMLRNHPLFREGTVVTCTGGQKALEYLEKKEFDILLCDIRMPETGGREVFRTALMKQPRLYIIMMTGFGSVSEAVRYIRDGAYDYISKPFEKEELLAVIDRIENELSLKDQVRSLQIQLDQNRNAQPFVFSSDSMVRIHNTIQSIRDSDFNVLLLGESGTGKEVIADAVHFSSSLRDGPFIKINCAGLVENLLESEIFGHEKGAFTGAHQTKKGKFELAEGGTIFLDEIGDMAYNLQAKMLRVLQDGTFERVGGTTPMTSDARVITATNHDLLKDIESGAFRKDLYYRLNTITLHIPPLRERRSEIPELAVFFLERLNRRYKRTIHGISPDVLEALNRYDYPGNVRELENIISRSFATAAGDRIELIDLPEDIRHSLEGSSPSEMSRTLNMKEGVENLEREYISRALDACGGKKNQAAEQLGISRRILYYKMEKYGIPLD